MSDAEKLEFKIYAVAERLVLERESGEKREFFKATVLQE